MMETELIDLTLREFSNNMELVSENQSDIMFNVNNKQMYQKGSYIFKDFNDNILILDTIETKKSNEPGFLYFFNHARYNGLRLEMDDVNFITDKATELINEGI